MRRQVVSALALDAMFLQTLLLRAPNARSGSGLLISGGIVNALRAYLEAHHATPALTGAGISARTGISDLRSADDECMCRAPATYQPFLQDFADCEVLSECVVRS